jgi:hypothetical protein
MATIYKDSLVEITDTGLTLHHYYFPFGDRNVAFDELEEIEVFAPSIWRGRWRIWGSGDLRTWFPLDWKRPSRDRIFIAHLRGKTRRIGFTVENSAQVEKLLTAKRLLSPSQNRETGGA